MKTEALAAPALAIADRRSLTRRAISCGGLGAMLQFNAHAAAQAQASPSTAHVRDVTQNLLPAVRIEGRPLRPMTLAARMALFKIPAVSVAHFAKGAILSARAYGSAWPASRTPATPGTLFQAASMSKPLAGVAALRLVQDGLLDLDGDVEPQLGGWRIPRDSAAGAGKVTLRQLLSHTAGFPTLSHPGYAPDAQLPTLRQIALGQPPATTPAIRLQSAPGEVLRYSGAGFDVLQLLLETVTGRSFSDLLVELVLRPCGMSDSTFVQPLPQPLQERAAWGFDVHGAPNPQGWRAYPEMAATGLWTTPTDLARFAIEVQATNAGRSTRLLSQALIREALTRQPGGWGLGFTLGGRSEGARFGHGGANPGFQGQFEAFSATGEGVAIMTNSDQGLALVPEILRAFADVYGWPAFQPTRKQIAPLTPAALAQYAGVYGLAGQPPLGVATDGRSLYATAETLRPRTQVLLPEGGAKFFIESNGVEAEFVTDSGAETTQVVLRIGPQTITLPRQS